MRKINKENVYMGHVSSRAELVERFSKKTLRGAARGDDDRKSPKAGFKLKGGQIRNDTVEEID